MNFQQRLALALAIVGLAGLLPLAACFGWLFQQALMDRAEGDGLRIASVLARSLSVIQDLPTVVDRQLGEQAIATGRVLAELVDASLAGGESVAQIQTRLDRVVATSVLDEIWITDSTGCSQFHPTGTSVFCFNPDARRQPQAHVFWPLLTGQTNAVIQEARQREIDRRIFKYVGVAGRDRPRIVQVGQEVPFLKVLQQDLGPSRLVDELVHEPDVVGIWVVDQGGKPIAGQAKPGQGFSDMPSPDQLQRLRQGLVVQQVGTFTSNHVLQVVVPLFDHQQTLKGSALIVLNLDRLQSVLVWQLVGLAGLVLVGLVVALGLSYAIANRMVQPILSLNSAAQAIARGDWSQPLPIDREDEFGTLARSLSRMVEQLQHYLATLETRVEERTYELARANEEISILNERLTSENARMEAELDVVRRLHRLILPKEEELSNTADLDIATYVQTADEVGGDYHDVWRRDGRIEIGIGDVTGHGLESGMVMLMVQAAVRTLAASGETDPVRTMNALNRLVYDNTRRMRSHKNMTLSLLSYDNGKIQISGQHEDALIVRANGEVEQIDTLYLGFPLGLERDISAFVDQATIDLDPGDVMLLYTDGIIEAIDAEKHLYGPERLLEILVEHHDRPAPEICQAVVDDVYGHIGRSAILDDITLIVIKRQDQPHEDQPSST